MLLKIIIAIGLFLSMVKIEVDGIDYSWINKVIFLIAWICFIVKF